MKKKETIQPGIIKNYLKNGVSYRFTVALGMTMDGKQIRKTKTYKPPHNVTSRKADKLAINEYYKFKDYLQGNTALDDKMRFSILFERYIEHAKSQGLKQTTITAKTNDLKRYIMPGLGNMRLNQINGLIITDIYKSLRKRNGQPLSYGTLRNINTSLSAVFSYAVKSGVINENPCKRAAIPKNHNTKMSDTTEKCIDKSDIHEFLSYFDRNTDLDIFVKLLLYTGLREGELLGLSWDCVNFEEKKIIINKSLVSNSKEKYLSTPKTAKSIREVYISDDAIKLLHDQKINEKEKIIALGRTAFKHPEMVFTSTTGDYKPCMTIYFGMKARLKNTKFEKVTPHWLRHTFSSLLISNGVELINVSRILGHSNTQTTANIYSKVYDEQKKKTSDIIALELAN